MTDQNDSTEDRLNREIARLRRRTFSLWVAGASIVVLMGGLVFGGFNTITETRYVLGTARQTAALASDTGTKWFVRVTVEDQQRDVELSFPLGFPAPDDPICLRANIHRFGGHTSYTGAPMRLCNIPTATQPVD